ncbi:NYN domain-containing protein [Amycolatopsis sp. WAC 04197]|uniref:NYN domain-containing protein n=1 Tax=Amycolatopsis sp. WAC 04197 TaxID=2203199 RepID=UPI0018F41823|nr:NYN domain-containing protein [Amycolatopsis sp. WAC 04197]
MVFVDGFNLYHGLKDKHGRRYHWLDLEALATSLLKEHWQTLTGVMYFTARVRNDTGSLQRQSIYLDALEAHCPKVKIVDGRFQEKVRGCKRCGSTWTVYEEKETDVSIAIALLEHGIKDDFDVALIISGDSDLCPAVRALKRVCPDKRVVVAFPPARWSHDLKLAVTAAFPIGVAKIRQAQLPLEVVAGDGLILRRPERWVER